MPTAQQKGAPLPSGAISIAGSRLSSAAVTRLKRLTVDDSLDLPSMFELEFINSDAAHGALIEDQAGFDIGKGVEVKMGYGEQLTTLIIGEITGLEGDFTSGTLPRLTVRGYDYRHRLQRGRKVRTFLKQKDSEIAEKIAREAGLDSAVTDSKVEHDYVIQADQTDMEFLLERAQRIQYEVAVKDKKLLFRPVANAEEPILTLAPRQDLLEFHPRLSSVGQVSGVHVRGWDPKSKKEIVGRAGPDSINSKMGGSKSGPNVAAGAFETAIGLVSDIPVSVEAQAREIATSLLEANSLGFITGEGSCIGLPDLVAGKVIRVDGVGKTFSGLYYVTSVSHRLAGGAYTTHFMVRRNAI